MTTSDQSSDSMNPTDLVAETVTPKELNEYAKRVKAENDALRKEIFTTKLEAQRIDTSTGLGKAALKAYDGDLEPEKFIEYMKTEYDWEPPTQADTSETTQVDREAQQRERAQASVDALDAVSQAATPIGEVDVVQNLEAKMMSEDGTRQDAIAAMNAKIGAFLEADQQ